MTSNINREKITFAWNYCAAYFLAALTGKFPLNVVHIVAVKVCFKYVLKLFIIVAFMDVINVQEFGLWIKSCKKQNF
jgi:hypothetical protein